MAEDNPNSKDNLINLEAERQRMRARNATLRGKKLTKTQKGPDKPSKSVRWYQYLQLIIFLILVAWMLKSCQT